MWRIGDRWGIDVAKRLIGTGVGAGIGEIHGGTDLRLDLFVAVLNRLVVEDAGIYRASTERWNGIERARSRNLTSARERYLSPK